MSDHIQDVLCAGCGGTFELPREFRLERCPSCGCWWLPSKELPPAEYDAKVLSIREEVKQKKRLN